MINFFRSQFYYKRNTYAKTNPCGSQAMVPRSKPDRIRLGARQRL
nr:MAG TPA: hypothetical protein [Caudoviricetes sp.]